MAVVTGGVVSAVFAVPSEVDASANSKSMLRGSLRLPAEKIGATLLGVDPALPAVTGERSTLLLSPSTLLILQPASPAVAAATARLRRVFFTILLPV